MEKKESKWRKQGYEEGKEMKKGRRWIRHDMLKGRRWRKKGREEK